MIINGMLVPPPNIGDELEPGEPGYQAPARPDNDAITGYLTDDQKQTLREGGRVESCARQQLVLLDAAHRMSAASSKLGRDFVELSATGKISITLLVNSMVDIESAAAKLLVTLQELRYQIGGMSERDVIGSVLRGVNFDIANKQRALEFERKANPAPAHNKEEK